jgi:hypothetical protein
MSKAWLILPACDKKAFWNMPLAAKKISLPESVKNRVFIDRFAVSALRQK